MVSRLYDLLLLPPLHHDDMIPKPGLHLGVLGAIRRARLQLVRCLLKRRVQTPAGFPAERPAWEQSTRIPVSRCSSGIHTLSSLILGELPGDIIEFGPVAELLYRLFFFRVFFALSTLAREIDMQTGYRIYISEDVPGYVAH
jgi:hypothetical protein